MRLQSHVSLTLNKAVAARALQSQLQRPSRIIPQWNRPLLASQLPSLCRYQSTSKPQPENIAILGGGIAGLSSAYFVSREFPQAKITLFEAGKETGGWIKSRRVPVEGQDGQKGDVLFELGPRTLRNSTVTAGLVRCIFLVGGSE
jgi:oxygen-dependent protoporphyrinogen oxidase